ncbi:hypothetical protein [Flavobacterium sp. UBA7682]|uniref:hypothetical protein n=1 Tax=Flavobacterium sp. UBA7682 TaxID=1946560 RepID=UPI0025BA57AC|nr:hypothetical protein [Flavobacterium sp. UBA7682]
MTNSNLNTDDLYNAVVQKLSFPQIHPLHKAILEECCENALEKSTEKDIESLISLVQLIFMSCESTLRGMIKGTFEAGNPETVTLNYRNQTFIIDKTSGFLK